MTSQLVVHDQESAYSADYLQGNSAQYALRLTQTLPRMANMDIGTSIRTARKAKGLTLEELANTVGTDTGNLSRLERGLQGASQELLSRIMSALGMSLSVETQKPQDPVPGAPSEKDYALIPQFTAKGSAGSGHWNDHVEVKGGLAFKREWLARLGVKEHRCSIIYASGNSMEPSIFDGEVVLIDHDDIEPRDGKVYVLQRADGDLIIKRLVKQMAGWVIRSDNEDKRRYPDEPVSADDLQQIEIVGRVVWRGGGM